MIAKFKDDYEFLSLFSRNIAIYDDVVYQSAEAAFQAAKLADENKREEFSKYKHAELARRHAIKSHYKIRCDYNTSKDIIMYKILKSKYKNNNTLKEKLILTGDEEIINSDPQNKYYDTYWGVVNGKGKNQLGKILMRIREDLRKN